jgi:hypothetical protein
MATDYFVTEPALPRPYEYSALNASSRNSLRCCVMSGSRSAAARIEDIVKIIVRVRELGGSDARLVPEIEP